MADSYLERVAGEIADLALADEKASGDIGIIEQIAKVLGSSSQTLEEAFLTAVRVRKAEARARALLEQRAENGYAEPTKPGTAPMQGALEAAGDAPEDDAETMEDALTEGEAAEDGAAQTQELTKEQAKEQTLERLKQAGIGAPRRVQR